MNVECQTIRVPTGVQDYRPALYGGIAAIELGVDGIRRVGDRRRPARARAADRARLHRRAAQFRARTTGRSPSATSTAIGTSSTASSGFATPRSAMRTALERGDWDEVGRQIADRVGEPQAAGARRHDADNRRPDRAGERGRRDGGQGVRRGRRRLSVLLRPARVARGASPRRWPPAARACSTTASRPKACGLDNPAIARILREIADLLEIKDENPFKIRAYRNGADIVAEPPARSRGARRNRPARDPGHRQGPRRHASARLSQTGDAEFHRELVAEFPPTILDLLHLQGVGPKTVATLYRELGIRTLDDLERAAADGRIRALRGHGREERSAHPQGARGAEAIRRPPSPARTRTTPPRRSCPTCASARPTPPSSRSAASGAAATPAATSTSSPPARRRR